MLNVNTLGGTGRVKLRSSVGAWLGLPTPVHTSDIASVPPHLLQLPGPRLYNLLKRSRKQASYRTRIVDLPMEDVQNTTRTHHNSRTM
jgi:hypothetical protein